MIQMTSTKLINKYERRLSQPNIDNEEAEIKFERSVRKHVRKIAKI
ncbi:hypothetical protein [Staphylococcus caprae]|nr:hypothetical protein [Staphylococcus caprae]